MGLRMRSGKIPSSALRSPSRTVSPTRRIRSSWPSIPVTARTWCRWARSLRTIKAMATDTLRYPGFRRRRNPGYLSVSVAIALIVRSDRAHRHHVRAVTGMLGQEDLIRRVGDTVLDGDLSADDGIFPERIRRPMRVQDHKAERGGSRDHACGARKHRGVEQRFLGRPLRWRVDHLRWRVRQG